MSISKFFLKPISVWLFLTTVTTSVVSVSAQAPSEAYVKKETPKVYRARGLDILEKIRQILELKYFDRSFRGLDIAAKFKSAEERIKTLDRKADVHRTIADVLVGLNDSHTIFYPPDLLYRVEYGFSMMTIGNACFVVDVKKESDADAKGLRAGDEVLSFVRQIPSRENLDLINYIIYSLEPQEDITMKVRSIDLKEREVSFKSTFISPETRKKERKKRRDDLRTKPFTCVPIGSEIIACRLRTFEVEKVVIDKMMKEASTRQKLILDLRGNPGGYVETATHLTGWFFNHDVKIGTEKGRNKSNERVAKGRAKDAYSGEVILLIDSESASASEVFARVLQIEKRARVMGDMSKGAVMTSERYAIATNSRLPTINEVNVPYYLSYLSLSVADLIMSDGARIEGYGVMPDLSVGPTRQAIRDRSDPVLAYAAELFGTKLTEDAAGKFYFLLPKTEELTDKTDDEATAN
jgi:C-terminal processing protease CtpA/Prc